MSKVSPEPNEENDFSNLLTENKSSMENKEVTTSFSSTGFTNYNAIESSQKPNGTNFRNDSARMDSLYNLENKLEAVDITEQSLHQIARDGNVMLMKAVLKQMPYPSVVKKKINQKDSDRFTPLHYAARYNRYDMCELLVKNGSNLHARGEDNLSPLHMVAKYKPKKEKIYGAGDGVSRLECVIRSLDRSATSSEDDSKEQQEANIQILNFLVDNGANVNVKDFYGLTPLHHACLRGNDACADNLLQCKGISIEPKDQQLMTPLHVCAVYGHTNLAKLLIENGADIRVRDGDDGTPLQYAAAEGKLEIIQLMFDQCVQSARMKVSDLLDETDSDGNTPLHLAVDNGHLAVTNYLIDMYLIHKKGVGLGSKRSNRETPLHIAARHGHLEIVKVLVEKGAKINARNDSMQTPLFLAAQFDHGKVIEFLIQCGANIEVHDTDHYTALLVAASYGHSKAMQILLENKADILAVDKNDKTIVYICAEEDRVEVLQVLFQLKENRMKSLLNVTDRYDNTPLHVAASNGHIAIVKVLLDQGAIIDSKNDDEQTPLHLAAENGSVKIVREMVNRQREIAHDDDENGNTPLHLAALSGRAACVRELVRLGANTTARNSKEWTPLDCCAYAGMHKSAIILLEADAPVDPKDRRKQTPLHLACVWGHKKMVEILLGWGADVTHRAVSGKNALDFAIDFGRSECASVIIESDRWREALENRTYDYKLDQNVNSPMRKLIRKMPSIAIQVFRKCLEDNGKYKDDPKYRITFDYEFLDDEFSCRDWADEDELTTEVNMTPSKSYSQEQAIGSSEVYDDDGRVLKSALPYTTDTSLLRNNHPLYVMVKSKRVDLLRHPLVVSLLNHKWRAYGRAVYYTNLLVYVFFLAVLNSYALTTPPPYAVDFVNTTEISPCVYFVQEAQFVWGTGCRFPLVWQSVSSYIIIVLAGLGLLKEFYQMATQRLSYLKSFTNFIEVAAYALAILLVIDVSAHGRSSGVREAWQWQCGAGGIFLSWMGLLLFIQNFPTFGIFVLMFTDIFWTFASFFFVFLLFILGFAFSFHLLLQNQYAFVFWWNSIVKTSVMMIGEFDYDSIFNTEFTDQGYTSQVQYEGITYTLFVIFVIIMSIIIVNLLVGLAVDDIKEVQDNAKLESLAMQVSLALDIEYTLPLWFRRRYMKKFRTFSPNQFRHTNPVSRWLHSESHLNHDTIEEALNPEKTDLENIDAKIDFVQLKMRDLRGVVYDMNDRSRQVESMVRAIAKHHDLGWEDDEDDDKNNAA